MNMNEMQSICRVFELFLKTKMNHNCLNFTTKLNKKHKQIISFISPVGPWLPQWRWRALIMQALEIFQNSVTPEEFESLPADIIAEHKLLYRQQAVVNIHFPTNIKMLAVCQKKKKKLARKRVELSTWCVKI